MDCVFFGGGTDRGTVPFILVNINHFIFEKKPTFYMTNVFIAFMEGSADT